MEAFKKRADWNFIDKMLELLLRPFPRFCVLSSSVYRDLPTKFCIFWSDHNFQKFKSTQSMIKTTIIADISIRKFLLFCRSPKSPRKTPIWAQIRSPNAIHFFRENRTPTSNLSARTLYTERRPAPSEL